MNLINLNNVVEVLSTRNPVVLRRLTLRKPKAKSFWHAVLRVLMFWRTADLKKYELMVRMNFTLSDGSEIYIPKGFKCDLSSVPQILWCILPPNGDFEMSWLIHDYLYATAKTNKYTRAFADKEMFIWAKRVNTYHTFIHWKKIDNALRYAGVRLFGAPTWNKNVKA